MRILAVRGRHDYSLSRTVGNCRARRNEAYRPPQGKPYGHPHNAG